MFFHISILVFALSFFGLLEAAIVIPMKFSVLVFFLLAILFRALSRFGGSVGSAIIPTLFSFSSILLLFFISSPREKHVFIFLSSLVFYTSVLGVYRLRQYAGDMTAGSMLSLVAMTTLFFLFSGFFGIFLNFQRFSEWMLMTSYGLSSFLVGLSVFVRLFRNNPRKAWFFALLFGFSAAEIGWIGTFWPFGYLTSGVITLLFLSPLWDMIQGEASGGVSKKRLAVQVTLILFLIGMVLGSSEWLPVV